MVVDNSYNSNAEASLRHLHAVQGGQAYDLKWCAKAKDDNQAFVVGVECYDRNDQLIWFENRFEEYRVGPEWQSFSMSLGQFVPGNP